MELLKLAVKHVGSGQETKCIWSGLMSGLSLFIVYTFIYRKKSKKRKSTEVQPLYGIDSTDVRHSRLMMYMMLAIM